MVGHLPAVPSQGPPGDGSADDDQLAAALGGGGDPRIFRLLRGDRAALTELVTAMAGERPR